MCSTVRLSFDRLVSLDGHADEDLIRLCMCLSRLRGHVDALQALIVEMPAKTADGERMKSLTV
jgi:hypothetical protein